MTPPETLFDVWARTSAPAEVSLTNLVNRSTPGNIVVTADVNVEKRGLARPTLGLYASFRAGRVGHLLQEDVNETMPYFYRDKRITGRSVGRFRYVYFFDIAENDWFHTFRLDLVANPKDPWYA